MPSWQSRLVVAYYRLQRVLHPPTGELDVATARADLEATAGGFKPAIDLQVTAANAGGVQAEWLVPPDVLSDRVVLYFHGGSYNSGSARSHRSLAGHVAHAAGARGLNVDYRLAPEHSFPAAVEDALASYRWLLDNDLTPDQIAVAGDSAGGGLVLALLVALRDEGQPLPAAGVCLSPWTDLAATGESWRSKARAELVCDPGALKKSAQLYLNGANPHTPLASPLYADLSGLPPLLIQVGTEEILLSDSTRLAEKARSAGVDVTLEVWPGMGHEWHFVYKLLPEARRAIKQIGTFVRQAYERQEGGYVGEEAYGRNRTGT